MTASDGRGASAGGSAAKRAGGCLLVFQFLVLLREARVPLFVGGFYVEGLRVGARAPLSVLHLGRFLINGAFVVVVGYAIALMAG